MSADGEEHEPELAGADQHAIGGKLAPRYLRALEEKYRRQHREGEAQGRERSGGKWSSPRRMTTKFVPQTAITASASSPSRRESGVGFMALTHSLRAPAGCAWPRVGRRSRLGIVRPSA